MRRRFFITMLVVIRSLVPTDSRASLPGRAPGKGPPGYVPVPLEDIALYLSELHRAVGNDGKLALFFPDCAAPAAPFLLFRLKREGYSDCRVISTGDGLLVDATR